MLRSGREVRKLEDEVAQLRAQVALLEDRLREKSQSEAGLQSFILQRRTAPAAEYLTCSDIIEANGITAWPVARDASSWRYSVLVNRGTEHGVIPGAAVTSGGALVGEVKTSSRRSSRVLLICDPHSRVPVRFLDAGSPERAGRILPADHAPTQGLLSGVRPGLCWVQYVPRDAEIAVGDTVVTSGLDGRFPSGLLVGKVTGTKRQELFLDVEVAPSVPTGALRTLIVLRPKKETESPKGIGSPGVAQSRPDAAQERQIRSP
jgi:rod shape-determining protein MreC